MEDLEERGEAPAQEHATSNQVPELSKLQEPAEEIRSPFEQHIHNLPTHQGTMQEVRKRIKLWFLYRDIDLDEGIRSIHWNGLDLWSFLRTQWLGIY